MRSTSHSPKLESMASRPRMVAEQRPDPRRERPPPALTVDAGETSAHRIEGRNQLACEVA
ncbi:MAG: hypothetical protein DMD89_04630 [Candidatus Rokuibacteriota bacterium]|nr:MAG: hypothetical protein DMD89_04630 [Candidatus Rokubacteria bacterium]